jgi:hypothetical protein
METKVEVEQGIPGCCIYGPPTWRMAYELQLGFSWADGDHNLPMMMVVPNSAGDAS